jgi:hypothetical protein
MALAAKRRRYWGCHSVPHALLLIAPHYQLPPSRGGFPAPPPPPATEFPAIWTPVNAPSQKAYYLVLHTFKGDGTVVCQSYAATRPATSVAGGKSP